LTIEQLLEKVIVRDTITSEMRQAALYFRDLHKSKKNKKSWVLFLDQPIEWQGQEFTKEKLIECYHNSDYGDGRGITKIRFIKKIQEIYGYKLRKAKHFSEYLNETYPDVFKY